MRLTWDQDAIGKSQRSGRAMDPQLLLPLISPPLLSLFLSFYFSPVSSLSPRTFFGNEREESATAKIAADDNNVSLRRGAQYGGPHVSEQRSLSGVEGDADVRDGVKRSGPSVPSRATRGRGSRKPIAQNPPLRGAGAVVGSMSLTGGTGSAAGPTDSI